jgi:hypothetical protein
LPLDPFLAPTFIQPEIDIIATTLRTSFNLDQIRVVMQSTQASSHPKTSNLTARPRETTIQKLSGSNWKFEQSFWTADGKAVKTILEKTPVNTNDPSALKGTSKFGDHLHYGYDGARGVGTVNVE